MYLYNIFIIYIHKISIYLRFSLYVKSIIMRDDFYIISIKPIKLQSACYTTHIVCNYDRFYKINRSLH